MSSWTWQMKLGSDKLMPTWVLRDICKAEHTKHAAQQRHAQANMSPNAYLQSFLNIQELIDKGTVPQTIAITIHVDKRSDGEHARCFNLPTNSEVSILLLNQYRSSQDSRTVVCTYRAQGCGNRSLQHFKDTNISYDPLCFPIIFLYVTDGVHLGIDHLQSTNSYG